MKKQIMTVLTLSVLMVAPSLMANHEGDVPMPICPFTTLQNAEELKLSAKQKEQVEKVKQEVVGMMSKIDGDMKAILSKSQVKKYDALAGKGHKGDCGKHKGDCEGKKKCSLKDKK